MKKFCPVLFLLLFLLPVMAFPQITIFTETMGTPAGATAITAHESSNGFDNIALTMSGTGDVENILPSTGYTGASGGGNVFLTNTGGTFFQVDDINTNPYTSLTLTFGHYKSTDASNNELVVEVSSDGTNYNALSYTRATGPGTSNWLLITPSGSIPSTSNLRIRFRQTSASAQFRIDDVTLTGVNASSTKYWDVSTNPGVGGTGTWGATFSTVAAGSAPLITAPPTDEVIYEGTPGTVILAASQAASNHTFNEKGYSIATSGTGSKTLMGPISLTTSNINFAPIAGADLMIPGVISGTGAADSTIFTKSDAGTLTLNTTNTFTGKVLISAGMVAISGESRLGASPAVFTADQVTLNGGGIRNIPGRNLSFSVSNRGIFLGPNNGILEVTAGQIIIVGADAGNTTGVLSGPGSLIKNGNGVLVFDVPGSTHNYTGNTILNAGILVLGNSDDIPDASDLILIGGWLNTAGQSDMLGTLTMQAASGIALTGTPHLIQFANSSGSTWSGGMLTITGWQGTGGSSGTAGRLFLGNDNTGLNSSQLSQISFTGYPGVPVLLATGELVPQYIPASIALSASAQAKGPFCNTSANSVSLTYTTSGTVSAPFLQLSDASGDFGSGATNIGNTISGSGTFTISGMIPALQAAGTRYRLRVVSTDATPVMSADNQTDIIIEAPPALTGISGGATAICVGAATPAFINSTSGGTWSIIPGSGGATITAGGVTTGTSGGMVSVAYTVTSGSCQSIVTTPLRINALPADPKGNISASAKPSCGPATLSYPAAVAPLIYYWQTVSNGVSTANPTVADYILNATGTIYVRSFNSSTGCWSAGELNSGVITVINPLKYYRSITSGSWTTPGNWEMSDNIAGPYTTACNYPVSANSDEVLIRGGHTITLVSPVSISVDKVTIEPTGELETGVGSLLTILNGQTGADLIVDGTLYDRSSDGNGISYEDNPGTSNDASWQMGASGRIIKSNNSSIASYKDFYEGGMALIPASASFYFRADGDGNPSTGGEGYFYPNLFFENTTAGNFSFNQSNSAITGGATSGSFPTVLGNLTIGGTPASVGTVSVYNNNINSTPMQVNGDVTINAGSTFTNNSYDGTNTTARGNGTGLEVKGNLTVNGTLELSGGVANTGNLVFSGNSGMDQNVSGTGAINLEDIKVNNSGAGSVVINNNIDISGTLDFGNNAAKLTLGTGNITMKSSVTRTANVGIIPTGVTINYSTGKFIIERMLLSDRKWRLLSVPTNDPMQTISTSWQENYAVPPGYGVWLVDTRANWSPLGFDGPGNNNSVQYLNDATGDWVPVPNTNTMPLRAEQGYMVFVAGDRTMRSFPGFNQTTLRTSGQLYRNDQVVPVPGSQFTVIGNPYASRIDLTQIDLGLNIAKAFYVWDPSLTGVYGLGAWNTFYDSSGHYANLLTSSIYGAAGSVNDYIESGQAVVVRSFAVPGTVTFHETDKVNGSNPALTAFTSGQAQQLRVNLHQIPAGGNAPLLLDGVLAKFDPTNSNGLEKDDLFKMSTFGENISWKTSDSLLVIDNRYEIADRDTLSLHLAHLRLQNYQLVLSANNLDYPGRTGVLIDNYLQTRTALNMAGATNVYFFVENIPASYAPDRFYIVFRQNTTAPLPVIFTAIQAWRNANKTIDVQWNVSNETGISNYEVQRSGDGIHFTGIGTVAPASTGSTGVYLYREERPLGGDNYYRIRASVLSGLEQFSAIVKVGPENLEGSIVLYPNPVRDGRLRVHFNGMPPGRYTMQLMNTAGQVLLTSVVPVSGNVQTASRQLPGHLASGTYLLKVSGNKKQPVVIKVEIVR